MPHYDPTTSNCPVCGHNEFIAALDVPVVLILDAVYSYFHIGPAKSAHIAGMELKCLLCGTTDNTLDGERAAGYAPAREACAARFEGLNIITVPVDH